MTGSSVRTIYLPWYSRADYATIRSAVTDPHSLAPTYELWLMAAQNNELVAQQAGLQVVRVAVPPDEFTQWCAECGLAPDSRARTAFAQEKGQGRPPASTEEA